MGKSRTISEMYNCSYQQGETAHYALPKWYNTVIDKTPQEVNIADVLKMLPQKIFIEVALQRSIDILNDDPFAAELWQGQLLEQILQSDIPQAVKYKKSIFEIIARAKKLNGTYDWQSEESREKFSELLNTYSG